MITNTWLILVCTNHSMTWTIFSVCGHSWNHPDEVPSFSMSVTRDDRSHIWCLGLGNFSLFQHTKKKRPPADFVPHLFWFVHQYVSMNIALKVGSAHFHRISLVMSPLLPWASFPTEGRSQYRRRCRADSQESQCLRQRGQQGTTIFHGSRLRKPSPRPSDHPKTSKCVLRVGKRW